MWAACTKCRPAHIPSLCFAVSFADVSAELDQLLVHGRVHGVGAGRVKEALLAYVKAAGASVGDLETQLGFLRKEAHPAVFPYAIVAACLPAFREAAPDRLGRELAHDTMRREGVNAVSPFALTSAKETAKQRFYGSAPRKRRLHTHRKATKWC